MYTHNGSGVNVTFKSEDCRVPIIKAITIIPTVVLFWRDIKKKKIHIMNGINFLFIGQGRKQKEISSLGSWALYLKAHKMMIGSQPIL